MIKVNIMFSRANDGTYSAYCEEYPSLFGMGDSTEDARKDLEETLRLTRDEIGKEKAAVYPGWLDGEYELESTPNSCGHNCMADQEAVLKCSV